MCNSLDYLSKRAIVFNLSPRCMYCERKIYTPEERPKGISRKFSRKDLDHWIPKVLGGSNNITNMVACCFLCNQEKGSMSIREWFRFLRYERMIDTQLVQNRRRRLLRKLNKKYCTSRVNYR